MDKRSIAFWFMIMLVVALSIYILYFIKTESYACMSQPLVYGVSKYNTDDTATFTCTCSSQNANGFITVTKNNITFTQNYLPDSYNKLLANK